MTKHKLSKNIFLEKNFWVVQHFAVLAYVLLHIPSSAMEWMDPCTIRGRQHEANVEKYHKQGE